MTSRRRIIRLRARELLREGEARHFAEAVEQAAQEVDAQRHTDRHGHVPQEVTDEVVAEAADDLFTNDPVAVTDEDVADAADRMFGTGRSLGNLSEFFGGGDS